ncbi:MAG: hypothetical protein AAF242_09110, partial [Bacteroidota bacterium]
FKENGYEALPACFQTDVDNQTLLSNAYIEGQLRIDRPIYCVDAVNYFAGAQYLSEVAIPQKDQYGTLPFKIIGQNALTNAPIVKDIQNYSSKQVPEGSFYTVVIERTTDAAFWPASKK